MDIGHHTALQEILEKANDDSDGDYDDTEKVEEYLRDFVDRDDGLDFDNRLKEFERVGTIEAENATTVQHLSALEIYNQVSSLQHVDFEVKLFKLLHIQDFSWPKQGFDIVSSYLPQLSSLLDEQFDHIYNLTYNQ